MPKPRPSDRLDDNQTDNVRDQDPEQRDEQSPSNDPDAEPSKDGTTFDPSELDDRTGPANPADRERPGDDADRDMPAADPMEGAGGVPGQEADDVIGDRPAFDDERDNRRPDTVDEIDTKLPGIDGDADDPWGTDSLASGGVSYEEANGSSYWFDEATNTQYVSHEDGSSSVIDFTSGEMFSGDEASRMMDQFQRDLPDRLAGGPGAPAYDYEGRAGVFEEQMGPPEPVNDGPSPSEVLDQHDAEVNPVPDTGGDAGAPGGSSSGFDPADTNQDGDVGLGELVTDFVGQLISNSSTSKWFDEIDAQMNAAEGSSGGNTTSSRPEQQDGVREEIERQDGNGQEGSDDKEETDTEETDKEDAAEADTDKEDAAEAESNEHPGWDDGSYGHRSDVEFDAGPDQGGGGPTQGQPGNIDPNEDGYGDGAGDPSEFGQDDLTQPNEEGGAVGNGTATPEPDPIDYGDDHVDPIQTDGMTTDDPFQAGSQTVDNFDEGGLDDTLYNEVELTDETPGYEIDIMD